MQRRLWRQVAIAGLALLLLGTGLRWWLSGRPGASTKAKEELDAERKWLTGTVIVVDPGHGGDDPGAVVGDVVEKGIVLDIANRLKTLLEAEGATVVLTRDRDESLGGPLRVELGRRVALVKEHQARLYISIHANKDRCNCWGAQTFFQKNGDPQGKELATAIQLQLRRLTPTTRTPLPADYYVLRNASVPAAMVEVGFLTNTNERQKLQEAEYQRVVASAVALGITDFLKSQDPRQDSRPPNGQR